MLDLPVTLNRSKAQELLESPDTQALSALAAAASLIGDDILDEQGQPCLEEELTEMLKAEGTNPADVTITRICGLLYAVSGDEFLEDPDHFQRMVGAVVEGDLFSYEDEEPPSIPDVFWALYQIGLTVEDDLVSELGPRVQRYLEKLAEDEAEDVAGLQDVLSLEGSSPEDLQPYADQLLIFRRTKLASELRDLGCKPEWVADLDEELAEALRPDQS